MLDRIFPRQLDNRYNGHWMALVQLGIFVALKLIIGFNTIFNTRSVAVGGDGFDLAAIGPAGTQALLMMFSMVALGQLVLGLLALIVLLRYRAMIPLMFLLLLIEHGSRRAIVLSHAVDRTVTVPVGAYINLGLLILLVVGLCTSLIWKKGVRASPPG